MAKNVTLVSKDGETELVFDNPTDITQYKALGFTEKVEDKSDEKAAPAKADKTETPK